MRGILAFASGVVLTVSIVAKNLTLIVLSGYIVFLFLSTGASMDKLFDSIQNGALSASTFFNTEILQQYNDFNQCLVQPKKLHNLNMSIIQAIIIELASSEGINVFREVPEVNKKGVAEDLCVFTHTVFGFTKAVIKNLLGPFFRTLFSTLAKFGDGLDGQDFLQIFVGLLQDTINSNFGPAQCILPIQEFNTRMPWCLCRDVYPNLSDVSSNPISAFGGCICGKDFNFPTGIWTCMFLDKLTALLNKIQDTISDTYKLLTSVTKKKSDVEYFRGLVRGGVNKLNDHFSDVTEDLCDFLPICRRDEEGILYIMNKDTGEEISFPKIAYVAPLESRDMQSMDDMYFAGLHMFSNPIRLPAYERSPDFVPLQINSNETFEVNLRSINTSLYTPDHMVSLRGVFGVLDVIRDAYLDGTFDFIGWREFRRRFRDRGIDFTETLRSTMRAAYGDSWDPPCKSRSQTEILRDIPHFAATPRVVPVLIVSGTVLGATAGTCLVSGACLATTALGVCGGTVLLFLIPWTPIFAPITVGAMGDYFTTVFNNAPIDQFSQDYVSDWIDAISPFLTNYFYMGLKSIDIEGIVTSLGSVFLMQSQYTTCAVLRQFMCAIMFGSCPPRPLHNDDPANYVFGVLKCEEQQKCSTVNDCNGRAKSCMCDGREALPDAPCNGTSMGMCHCWLYFEETSDLQPLDASVVLNPQCEDKGWMYKKIMPYQGAAWYEMIINWIKTTNRSVKLFTNLYSVGIEPEWFLLFIGLFAMILRCTKAWGKRMVIFVVGSHILSYIMTRAANGADAIAATFPVSYFEDDVHYYTRFPNAGPHDRGSFTFAEGQCMILTISQTVIILNFLYLLANFVLNMIQNATMYLFINGFISGFVKMFFRCITCCIPWK